MATSHLPSPPSDLFSLDFLSFNGDLDPTSPQLSFTNQSEHMDQSYASSSLPSRNGPQHGSTIAEAGPSNYLASQSYASSSGGLGSNANTPGNAGNPASSVANTPAMVPSIGTPNLAGTPNIPSNASHTSAGSRRGSMDEPKRGGSLRGRPRTRGKSAVPGSRTSLGGTGGGSAPIIEDSMDLDQVFNAMAASSGGGLEASQGMAGQLEGTEAMDAFAGNAFGPNGSYASAQAMLQQLENFHVQSPAILDPSNAQSPYGALSNLFMAHSQGMQPQGTPLAFEQQDRDQAAVRQWGQTVNGLGGFITPGPSGEMFPQLRPEMMSPMQLELLAKANDLDPMDPNLVPLLSPALTQPHDNSVYASPSTVNLSQDVNSHAVNGQGLSPIEALQEQQRQFQEQLMVLQQRQQQLQATAAAVAAQASPYLPSTSSGSTVQSRAVVTPGIGQHGNGGAYFSPLTSPALEATRNFHAHHYSPAIGPIRPPHPLSALSSPALNPVGSAGGANQTLSPALEPQMNGDLVEPDYLRGVRNSDRSAQGTPYQSPTGSSGQGSLLSTGGSTGPHRQALPQKTRPSPMIRPTHRSRQSTNVQPVTLPGQYSVPASPSILRHPAMTAPGVGSLPPAVIDQRGVQQALLAGQQAASNSSTPSPVDLAQIMPPPPVPSGTARGVVPMTPASLMNLGGGSGYSASSADTMSQVGEGAGPSTMQIDGDAAARARRPSASKAANGSSAASTPAGEAKRAKAANTAAAKKNLGKSTAAANKRLAMKPSAVGVRAGAAAAASLPLPEGETRKTSHKAAEQKRRDSLKAGFDELRLLLPAINTEALDPETGEPIPGSSAPRLLPKSSLVPDDNPNRGVSKVALLKFSNEYIVKLQGRLDKRDGYIDLLRQEIERLRLRSGGLDGSEVTGEAGEDLLEMDMAEGEEEEFGSEVADEEEDDDGRDVDDQEMMMEDGEEGGTMDGEALATGAAAARRRSSVGKGVSATATGRSPALGPTRPRDIRRPSSSSTVTARNRRGD